jgi:uncharacterized protein (DUF1015 family)
MAHSDPQALRVIPFRGLRFDPDRVRDPAAVTSPPYDMIGPQEAQRLADTEEHNVVRLILPGPDETDPGPRYRRAAASLAEWRAEGALRLDEEPGFYVYEQSGPGGRQRGLITLVHLDEDSGARSILPHEAVVPAVVDDRLAQMRATAAHIEPILLTYAGDQAVSDALDRVADGADDDGRSEPLSATTTSDGTCHRLWAITAPDTIGRISADLLEHRTLIADGHHRHAAYRKLRDESPGPGDAAAYGLALIVDSSRCPLSLHAIHRVLPNVPLDLAVADAEKVFRVREIGDPQHGLDGAGPDQHAFVLSDGARSFLLTDPDPAVLAAVIPADRPRAWRQLDATVLHHVLVETVWSLPDTPEEVRFDHDPHHAVAHAAEVGGTAVLLRPTTEAVVRELAAAGVLMPRKSTAFGPKPATGLVMRLLQEVDGGS